MVFYNPYHFVPLAGRDDARHDLPVDKFGAEPHLTHDKYVEKTHSGRIVCRLTAKTPFFVGAKIESRPSKTDPGESSHFEIEDKTPAIPGSSLRGVISSLAEAASGSAMRVLEDKEYSYRMKMEEASQAIGIIVEKNGKLELRPLALPSLSRYWRRQGNMPDQKPIWPHYKKFFDSFPSPPLKMYIDGYKKKHAANPPEIEFLVPSFLHNQEIATTKLESFSADNDADYWYLAMSGNPAWENADKDKIIYDKDRAHLSHNGQYLLGIRALNNMRPCRTGVPANRGILRVLGINGREKQMPPTKKHEIFIPYPPGSETAATFEIPEKVLEDFYILADERTEATEEDGEKPPINELLPYGLKGSKRNSGQDKKEERKIRLRAGDIVFFKAEDGEISKISISSIWRERVNGSSYDFFKAISKELLPFNSGRETISLAERLFGFISEEKTEGESEREDGQAGGGNAAKQETIMQPDKNGFIIYPNGMRVKMDVGNRVAAAPAIKPDKPTAFASRVRISNALFHPNDTIKSANDCYMEAITLKILDSPKPPSPAMYFKPINNAAGEYISKAELGKEDHEPQGRKMYLHHNINQANQEPWKTNDPENNLTQKMKIRPVKAGAEFWFHVDYDNLSDEELGLLCYALEPEVAFQHKIGMGKPIGLGSVKIEPVCVLKMDRKSRYSAAGFFQSRYAPARFRNGCDKESMPDVYKSNCADALIGEGFTCAGKIPKNGFTPVKSIDKAIKLLGDPGKVRKDIKVSTPAAGADDENETFKWFGNNDDRNTPNHLRQFLKPITEGTTSLQILKETI
jgi:CRISPR-associated protein (TIGR03986 family)